MSRDVPEWRGKNDDTPIPPRVKLRVFEAYGGKCHWTGQKIMPGDAWDADHIVALINGGENREANLAPILRGKAHKEKTAQDVAIKSKTARMRAKHLGIFPRPVGNARLQSRNTFGKKHALWQSFSQGEDHDH